MLVYNDYFRFLCRKITHRRNTSRRGKKKHGKEKVEEIEAMKQERMVDGRQGSVRKCSLKERNETATTRSEIKTERP
jgi:hypothetical protein